MVIRVDFKNKQVVTSEHESFTDEDLKVFEACNILLIKGYSHDYIRSFREEMKAGRKVIQDVFQLPTLKHANLHHELEGEELARALRYEHNQVVLKNMKRGGNNAK
jgi:hypothetical protein